VVCDKVDDFIAHYVYHMLQAQALGQHYKVSSELTEEEALQVLFFLSEEEKRRYPNIDDALALSMAQLHPPPPPGTPPPPRLCRTHA
jgi:hypothetical protein